MERLALLDIILLVLAFVCFAFSIWQHTSPYWNRIVSVGLAALTLSMLL